MRKILKIIFFIITIAYFGKLLLPFKIDDETKDYLSIIYLIIAVPYVIYENIQVLKDDKTNNTHTFRKRIVMVIIAAIFLILSSIFLNHYYKI